MVLADDRILEYVRENGSGSPKKMSEDGVRYSRTYVSQRCRKLVKHGLLDDLGNGVYTISERGEKYLDGELDTSEDAPDEIPETSNGPTAGGDEEQA